MTSLLDDLLAVLPRDAVLDDPASTDAYRRDHAAWAEAGAPIAVVRPRTPEQVQAVVQACLTHRAPVVPRGAGSGLSGGANAVDGCVVLCLERMDAVLEVDAAERLAVVQPGVVNDALRAHVAPYGLEYPPDPASSSWSTIGGNVATNAGGLCCVKYGVTGDYVLGLQVVTGTGELVRLGRRTAKGVAGYDLTALMVGSEGTLGVITEVTVRLRPLRGPERTVAGHFASAVDAGRAVAAVAAAGLTPSALFAARRLAYSAVERLGPVLTEDVCVPVAALAEMLGRVEAAAARNDVLIATVAHAGDGNVHPFIVTPAGDEAAGVRAHAAFEQLMVDALELGGTITGEHGIGLLKRDGLRAELPPAVLAMQHAVKAALDPYGLLNPGKVLALPSAPG